MKKKSGLRAKGKGGNGNGKSGSGSGPVLGGADYVALMMGGRRKAREEPGKLPRQARED